MNGDFREDLKRACEVMQKGGVILYPTDTIWGIGCDATNPEAVKRVYDIKKRADSKAMLVLVLGLAFYLASALIAEYWGGAGGLQRGFGLCQGACSVW